MTPAGPSHRTRPRVQRSVLVLHGAVIGGFLLLAVGMWWRVWITGHPTTTVTCQCGDVSEALGFLGWAPWAVLHGHNLFYSSAVYAGQGGANMLTNASWLAGSLLLSPVTLVFGAVASFNVALTLAPVVTGWCCFVALRRITTFVPGQVLGAALYGFSPLMIRSEPFGHFFQVYLFYPPLVFVALHELLVTRRHRPARVGVALGLLTVVQFFTGTEVLVITVFMTVVGLVVAALLAPRRAVALWRRALTGLGTGAVLAGALLAYPAWYALGGRAHIVGAAWAFTAIGGVPPDSVVNAGGLVHRAGPLLRAAGYLGPGGPAPDFVGFAVVLFVVVSAAVWYSRRTAWFLLITGAVSWALSLGTLVQPLRRSTNHIWLPWRLFSHLPVVSQVIPGRFAAITLLAVALLFGVSADAWWEKVRHMMPHAGAGEDRRARRLLGTALTAVTAAALVPLVSTYTLPFLVTNQPIPAWFAQVAPSLPDSTTVITYPYTDGLAAQAMGFQAEAGMHFRLVGGFLIVPGADGIHSEAISPFGGTRHVMYQLSNAATGPMPLPTPAVLGAVRTSLQAWGVDKVVVTQQGRNPEYAAGFYTAVLGRAPQVQDGAWVWNGLGRHRPLRVAPQAVWDCTRSAQASDGSEVPRCVMAAAGGPGAAVS